MILVGRLPVRLCAALLVAAGIGTIAPATIARPIAASTRPASVAPPTTGDGSAGELIDLEPFEQRVVLFGAEELLADALALGVEPIASSSTVGGDAFHGLPGYDTTDVEVLAHPEINLEYLASLRPDIVVVIEPIVDYYGTEPFTTIAELVVVPHDVTPEEQVVLLGAAFGREERAAELLAELDAAVVAADRSAGSDCTASVAVVYAGPEIAVFVGGSWPVPWAVQATGCRLVPGPDQVDADDIGRATISTENLELLAAPTLLMLQIPGIADEQAAYEQVTANELWQRLPAVAGDNVHVVDRIGYRGIEGRIRLLDEVVAIFAPAQ